MRLNEVNAAGTTCTVPSIGTTSSPNVDAESSGPATVALVAAGSRAVSVTTSEAGLVFILSTTISSTLLLA